ncbi:hypothetical protein LTR53_006067 [Teratosphaeriaceae sp. CCFEE 6253]|nr:hypothetical protein LTR53_006067 [Teratosphaeriaceae sp. CCFEE 6253]
MLFDDPAEGSDPGVLSNNERSDATTLAEFDRINGVNYRGCWLSSRAEITQMLGQAPLPTHDGRAGARGSVVIDTPMTRPNMAVLGPAIAIAPLARAGTAQEVADCVLFLASAKASFVQGSALVVDGGYVIN